MRLGKPLGLVSINQLHGYGIYGPRDYNAWLGKITCDRLGNGIDADAYKLAAFLSMNLPRGSTTAQTWQYLGAAVATYCPDQQPVLMSAAGPGPNWANVFFNNKGVAAKETDNCTNYAPDQSV
ncbi:MAG: hypothetical protein QOC63_3787 [Mycobacterium sp.]|jgi:hypothetical protein|nr:hypothetical protein [Mycobacterium sp.]